MSKNREKIRFTVHAALIAAMYAAVSLAFAPTSFGPVQLRVSEALCVLPYFTPAAIPGLAIGCLIANLLGNAVILDIVFGPIATLIGAFGTYLLRKKKWIAPLPPILANALIIPFVLSYGYGMQQAIPFMMLTVGIGEIISIYVLGMIFYFALQKRAKAIFGQIE